MAEREGPGAGHAVEGVGRVLERVAALIDPQMSIEIEADAALHGE